MDHEVLSSFIKFNLEKPIYGLSALSVDVTQCSGSPDIRLTISLCTVNGHGRLYPSP